MFQHKMQPTAPDDGISPISRYLWSWIHHAALSLPRRRFVASTTIVGEDNLGGTRAFETQSLVASAGSCKAILAVISLNLFHRSQVTLHHGINFKLIKIS